MKRVLIAADDLTGALDTAVQFSRLGIPTEVQCEIDQDSNPALQVISINCETRHLPGSDARRILHSIADSARHEGFSFFFKKVDSLLRGNPGAEIAGMLTGCGEKACYCSPAFPAQGRRIQSGQLILADKKDDPLNKVGTRNLFQLLAEQTKLPLRSDLQTADKEGIVVADAATENDLLEGLQSAVAAGFRVFAGSAGLGAALAAIIAGKSAADYPVQHNPAAAATPALIIAGSHNQTTLSQVDRLLTTAQAVLIELPADPELEYWREKCRDSLKAGQTVVLRTSHIPGITLSKANHTSKLLAEVASTSINLAASVIVAGGDTLSTLLSMLEIPTVIPETEPLPGTAAFTAAIGEREIRFFSKSGAFGDREYYRHLLQEN